MYKLTIFVPEEALERLKLALFAAGAGCVGNYSHCCWQVQGLGQFKPLAGSQPHIGTQDNIEQVIEWRVETVVNEDDIHGVIKALKKAHPYETPAYDVIQIIDI